jgi:glycosyltransferase 2 family protein
MTEAEEPPAPPEVDDARNRRRRLLSGIYLAVVFGAAAIALRSEWSAVVEQIRQVPLAALFGAAVSSVLALVAGMISWRMILSGLGQRVGLGGAAHVFFLSQLGKYLPGSVWPAIAQVEAGRAYGIRRAPNLASFVLATALSLGTGLATGALALTLAGVSGWAPVAVLSAAGMVLAVGSVRWWPQLARRVPRRLQRLVPPAWPDWPTVAAASALLVVQWLLHGVHLWFLASGMGLEVDRLLLRSIGGFAVAFVGGFLAIIAPAGAGVREAILVGVLAGPAGTAAATAVALLSRLVLVVADLTTGIGALVIGTRTAPHRRRATPTQPS